MRLTVRQASFIGATALLLLTGAAGPVTCSQKFQGALDTIVSNVNATNAAIAKVSPGIASSCRTLLPLASALAALAPTKHNVQADADAAVGALQAYCQNVPTDIASTATALTASIAAAKTAYAAAKAANG